VAIALLDPGFQRQQIGDGTHPIQHGVLSIGALQLTCAIELDQLLGARQRFAVGMHTATAVQEGNAFITLLVPPHTLCADGDTKGSRRRLLALSRRRVGQFVPARQLEPRPLPSRVYAWAYAASAKGRCTKVIVLVRGSSESASDEIINRRPAPHRDHRRDHARSQTPGRSSPGPAGTALPTPSEPSPL